MSKKSEKNCRKDNAVNTTIQTGRNCKNEAQNLKTQHPDTPEIRNYKQNLTVSPGLMT